MVEAQTLPNIDSAELSATLLTLYVGAFSSKDGKCDCQERTGFEKFFKWSIHRQLVAWHGSAKLKMSYEGSGWKGYVCAHVAQKCSILTRLCI